MARPFITTCLVSVAVALLAGSAWAVPTATFDENVFRLRVSPGESARIAVHGRASSLTTPGPAPDYFVVILREPVGFGPRCDLRQAVINSLGEPLELWCALDPASIDSAPLRFRLSFADGNDVGTGVPPEVRGVVYAGAGNDIATADRVFGGPGADIIDGTVVYGGVGDDWMNGAEVSARRQVLRGGPGDDRINDAVDVGPSWVYGGRGDDRVYGSYDRDMIVGGPGHDFVELTTDGKPDVVRLRNGGADRLRCHDEGFTELEGEPHDIVFVDKADRVDPYCKGARVLREGRPRLRR